jgi:Pathogenicity locus
MPKALDPEHARRLTDLPNIGPAAAADLKLLGILTPVELRGRDPYALYRQLCETTGVRHDRCVIDVFISAVRFMDGAAAQPWWHYTEERKSALSVDPSLARFAERR